MLKIAPIHYDQPTILPLQRSIAVLLVSRGEGVLRVGSDRVPLQPGRVFLLRQESKVYLEGVSLTGHLLEFQKVLLDHYLLLNIIQQNKGLFDFSLSLAFADIRTNTLLFLMSLITQLLDELDQGSDVSIFQHYLFLFLWHINRKVAEMNVHLSERELVMKKVMLLIEEHYTANRSPLFYASKLGKSVRRF